MKSSCLACQRCEKTNDPRSPVYEPWLAQPDELRMQSPWSPRGAHSWSTMACLSLTVGPSAQPAWPQVVCPHSALAKVSTRPPP